MVDIKPQAGAGFQREHASEEGFRDTCFLVCAFPPKLPNNLRPDLDMTRTAGTAGPKVQHRLARTELRQGIGVSAPYRGQKRLKVDLRFQLDHAGGNIASKTRSQDASRWHLHRLDLSKR